MTKAKVGCVQHDCAECKTMRRVYRAAMKWAELNSIHDMSKETGLRYYAALTEIAKACDAAKKGKK